MAPLARRRPQDECATPVGGGGGGWGLVGEVARGVGVNGTRPGLGLAQERQSAKLR